MTRARTAVPYLALVAFVASGGYVHLREWLDHYRYIPSGVPGAAVVRVGFPLDAGVSVILVIALTAIAFGALERRVAAMVVASTALFELASLVVLILTRTGTVLGWSEQRWTTGADQSRAIEIGALFAAAAIGVLDLASDRLGAQSTVHTMSGV